MNKETKFQIKYTASGLIKLLLGLLVVFPILYAFGMSFMTPAEITTPPPRVLPKSFTYLENYIIIFTSTKMLRFLINSLGIAIVATLGRLITASTASFAFSFFDFKGKKFLFFLVLASCVSGKRF